MTFYKRGKLIQLSYMRFVVNNQRHILGILKYIFIEAQTYNPAILYILKK